MIGARTFLASHPACQDQGQPSIRKMRATLSLANERRNQVPRLKTRSSVSDLR
jgi:hypothetical protein